MKLYFDIGNRYIKINCFKDNKDKILYFSSKKEYTPTSLFNEVKNSIGEENISYALISSVVPRLDNIVSQMVKEYFNIEPQFLERPIKIGIKLEVDNPKTLGADIICLAAFVASKTDNGVIVNMGTATTITHIKNNALKGVVIAPGLMSSYYSLIDKASKLYDLKLKRVENKVGKNTEDAINIGLINGHASMIEGLVSKIDKDADIYISGGDFEYIKGLLPYSYEADATLKGLKLIGDLNEHKKHS